MIAALHQATWSSHDFGVLLWSPGRVNLASKSRSGAPLGSLSDLLKGLAPSSRNANQPTRPNLTSIMPPNPRQGTLKIDNYARGSSRCSPSSAIYNPLAFWGEPDTSHHSEVLSARPVALALALGTPPHWVAPARIPAGAPSPGSQWPCPVIHEELSPTFSRVLHLLGSSIITCGLAPPTTLTSSLMGLRTQLSHPLQPLAPPTALFFLSHSFITSLAPDNPTNLKKGQNNKKDGHLHKLALNNGDRSSLGCRSPHLP